MKCTGCNYEFRYIDKRYGISTYYESKVVVQYRCAPCYNDYKEELKQVFSTTTNGVPY